MISSGVLKLVQICGLVFKRSTMILFTLPYPLFIFCYCLSSMFYIKRIIHRGFHIVWSLQHTICQLYWASEFSSSRNISLCLVPDTLLRQEVPAPVWCHHFISSVCLRIGFLQIVQFFEGAPYSDRWQIGTKLQKFGNRCSFRRKIESRWVLFMKMPSLLHNAVKCCTITVYLKYRPNLWLYILEIWCIKKDLVEKHDHNEFSI